MGARLSQEFESLRNASSATSNSALQPRATAAANGATSVSNTSSGNNPRTPVKNTNAQFSGSTAPSFYQQSTLAALANQLQQPMHVSLNSHGVPREIRVQRNQSAGGLVAQSASGNFMLQRSLGEPKATARAFLENHRGLLALDDPRTELEVLSEVVDNLGRRHIKYGQRYNGLPVWASSLVVHLDAQGNVDLMNGAFVPTPKSVSTKAVVSADEAVALARTFVPLGAVGTVLGPAKAMIYTSEQGGSKPVLAWQVKVTTDFAHAWMVLIDATTGAKLTAFNEVMTVGTPGGGVDIFGINRSLNVFNSNGTFFMVDVSKQSFDPTSMPPNVASTRGGIVILDAGNQPAMVQNAADIPQNQVTSSSATSGWLPDAVSASFGFSETYDYFLERHQRNGLDGEGGTIQATVRVGQNFGNAFFVGAQQAMFFGDGVPFAGALDVVGHELAHGVVSTTSNLIYENQSGALNESFSDIFGTAVQARTNGTVEWVIGDQLTQASLLRDMENPGRLMTFLGVPYPSRMSEFIVTNEDNGGVHINSSIPNHAFYQLAEGLPNSISLQDAELIFFRAFTLHLQQRSQFNDARLASIRAAEELFGAGSEQALRTAEAYDVVEIFDAPSTPEPSPFPEVQGEDALLAIAINPNNGANVLIRREAALGDPVQGSNISGFGVANGSRPSITGDGSVAAFVNDFNDLCIIGTVADQEATCLGFPGSTHSVTLSPDGTLLASILLTPSGTPANMINVTEIATGNTLSFTLVADALDGIDTNLIALADAIDFSSTGQFLIYDALNDITFGDGSNIQLWSIFALDLVTGRTLTVVPPSPGLVISFPTISQTSDNFFTFDVFDDSTGESVVVAANLNTGAFAQIGQVTQGFGVPAYTGDDSAIVYSQFDPQVPTQFSLVRQPVAADRITPVGQAELFLNDADFASIYRRGQFSGALDVDVASSQTASTTAARVGQAVTVSLGVTNQGTDPANNVALTNTLPVGATLDNLSTNQGTCVNNAPQFTCSLGTLAPGASANVTIGLTPGMAGMVTNASNVVANESESNNTNNSSFVTIVVSEVTGIGSDVSAPGAAVLPGSRSVEVGSTATAFATVINTSGTPIEGCNITLLDDVPVNFFFQTTDPATNALTGVPNAPVNLAANAAQSFLFGVTPTAPLPSTALQLGFDCANTPAAGVIDGVNTFLFSASATPVPDVVALGATAGNTGIVDLPGETGAAAFAIASVNVGASATVTVTPDTGSVSLPMSLAICETNPTTGACLSPPAATVTTNIGANATPTFSVFATGTGVVPFDPANNRIRVQFEESGQVRGATSVAVRTQ